MDDTECQGEAEIEITVETEFVDLDGDGTIDAVREVTTTVADVDGDGVPDIVEQTTVTAVDLNGDGIIDGDEIAIETVIAVREGFLEDADAIVAQPASTPELPTRGRRRWRDLNPGRRGLVVALAAVQLALMGAMHRDLLRRPASEVRGPKRMWFVFSFVNFVGPIAYFAVGRSVSNRPRP